MRARDIKPGFFKNDQLADCSMAARLLFPGLWMMADREGRLENRPKKIKGEIFPFDNVDVAPLLGELESSGLIRFYEVNGQNLIWIPQFKRHQSPHKNEKCSELPAHPDDFVAYESSPKHDNYGVAPEKDRSAPVISGQIPLTPSSLTPSSLSPREDTTPDGVVVGESTPTGQQCEEQAVDEHGVPSCPHKRIVALYHEFLPELPGVKVWEGARQQNLQARWRERWKAGKYRTQEEGIAYWGKLFRHVSENCDWLMGRVQGRRGDKPFRASLDWIVNASNFAKLIEGRYDNREVA